MRSECRHLEAPCAERRSWISGVLLSHVQPAGLRAVVTSTLGNTSVQADLANKTDSGTTTERKEKNGDWQGTKPSQLHPNDSIFLITGSDRLGLGRVGILGESRAASGTEVGRPARVGLPGRAAAFPACQMPDLQSRGHVLVVATDRTVQSSSLSSPAARGEAMNATPVARNPAHY